MKLTIILIIILVASTVGMILTTTAQFWMGLAWCASAAVLLYKFAGWIKNYKS